MARTETSRAPTRTRVSSWRANPSTRRTARSAGPDQRGQGHGGHDLDQRGAHPGQDRRRRQRKLDAPQELPAGHAHASGGVTCTGVTTQDPDVARRQHRWDREERQGQDRGQVADTDLRIEARITSRARVGIAQAEVADRRGRGSPAGVAEPDPDRHRHDQPEGHGERRDHQVLDMRAGTRRGPFQFAGSVNHARTPMSAPPSPWRDLALEQEQQGVEHQREQHHADRRRGDLRRGRRSRRDPRGSSIP